MAISGILHIAAQNVSGVPGQLVQAERRLGFNSRLVTLFRDKRNYFEDICLNLPFIDLPAVRWLKRFVSDPRRLHVDNRLRIPPVLPPVWRPHSVLEKLLVLWRDRLWSPRIQHAIAQYHLADFDVYELDGGLDMTRWPRFIPDMKAAGKKIVCCYTGSDLRTRGVIEEIDRLADAVVSVEFDHLRLHPRLCHVFFPFDADGIPERRPASSNMLTIGHAPTNRQAKGSDIIIPALERLAKRTVLQIKLIEGMTYAQALEAKRSCDIFIDQIGDLGYGINGLESLAMGIPTCSEMAAGFSERYPDHPFVEINSGNLEEQVYGLIRDRDRREKLSREGRAWVRKYHDPVHVVRRIHRQLGIQ
jgi:hypothetical protein